VVSMHTSHRLLLVVPASIYVLLVFVCAVLPAAQEQAAEERIEAPPPNPLVERGRDLYRAYNCVTCHTQQIRGDARLATEVDGERIVPVLKADARFGREVASRAEEYAHQEPPFLGTQRTGPDLSAVGRRLPEAQWHYWHLYNPRSVSPGSLMPSHRFLFTTEAPPDEVAGDYEKVLNIEGLGVPGTELWATPDALALVEYLLSLNREFIEEEGLAR